MSIVTTLWCMNAALSLTLAAVCLLFWVVERRNLAYLAFCVVAFSTALAIPFELGMMNARTAAEYGRLLRWYHVPAFFVLVGYPFFVRHYLGTGRPWLLWTVVFLRIAVLAVNFIVEPNINFREITSLRQVPFLDHQVSVVGSSVPRPAQWFATASVLLLAAFLTDAAIQSFRRGDAASRRRAIVVGAALLAPLMGVMVLNLLVTTGAQHFPLSNTVWYLGTLSVIGYDLGREVVISRRAQVQLARLRGELSQFDRVNTLGQFASGLAHELLRPLATTAANAGAAELLLQRAAPDLGELREIMADIQKETARAADTIRHMRLLIQRHVTDRQHVDVREVVGNVLQLASPEAASRDVVLDFRATSELPRAFCDPVQVSHVLLNLLVNGIDAVQACPDEGRRVCIEACAGMDGGLELAVLDSGPGIANDIIDEIFEPLYTTKAGGLGMGLAISRTIIEAHGGRLWATNDAATGGAIFRFTLPAAAMIAPREA